MIMIEGFYFPFTHQSLPPHPNILDQRSLRLHLANVHYPRWGGFQCHRHWFPRIRTQGAIHSPQQSKTENIINLSQNTSQPQTLPAKTRGFTFWFLSDLSPIIGIVHWVTDSRLVNLMMWPWHVKMATQNLWKLFLLLMLMLRIVLATVCCRLGAEVWS